MIEMLQNSTKYIEDLEAGIWADPKITEAFQYNDGDAVELKIQRIITETANKSVFSLELSSKIDDWPTNYHLSARRANLLRPIIDMVDGAILEVGAGCGAITRYMGEEGKQVLALEGSYRRASINAARCSDLKNVTVLCENFGNLDASFQFDTIVVIGVLEYSGKFIEATQDFDSWDHMISMVKTHLKPGGKAIFAIENQLGLKYFSGYPEDHLGVPYLGIEDNYADSGIATFGKQELQTRLGRFFSEQSWYYPFPDYKFPISVISDRGFNPAIPFDTATLCSFSASTDPQRPDATAFSLQKAWQPLQRNGLIAPLSNSFLVVVSNEAIDVDTTLAFHFGMLRKPGFNKIVRFVEGTDGIRCIRTPLDQQRQTSDAIVLKLTEEPYLQGEVWYDRLVSILNRDGWTSDQLVDWTRFWWAQLIKEPALQNLDQPLQAAQIVSGAMIDAIPRNMIVSQGEGIFFDQEWELTQGIELGFLLYRGLRDALGVAGSCSIPEDPNLVLSIDALILLIGEKLGLPLDHDKLMAYKQLESFFQSEVSGNIQAPSAFGADKLHVRMYVQSSPAETTSAALAAEPTTNVRDMAFSVNASSTEIKRIVDAVQQIDTNIVGMIAQHKRLLGRLAEQIARLDDDNELASAKLGLIELLRDGFSDEWYLDNYSDVKASGMHPFGHYLLHGAIEGRSGNGLWRDSDDDRN